MIIKFFKLISYKLKFGIIFFSSFAKFKVYNFVKFNDFLFQNKLVLEKKCKIRYLKPKFDTNKKIVITNLFYKYFPEVKFLTTSDCLVSGGTSFIVKDKNILHHDLFDQNQNYSLEEKQGRCLFFSFKKILWNSGNTTRKLNEAISLLDSTSFNYAHWITEILPKIYLLKKYFKNKKFVLLIDKNLHKNLYDSINILLKNTKFKLLYVQKDESIYIKKLHIISPVGYSNHSPKNTKKNHSHGIFHQKIIKEMSTYLSKNEKLNKNKNYKKIYLSREGNIRNIIEDQKVNKFLKSLGYKKLVCENYKILRQIQFFKNAKIVVASGGAALANLIFSQNKIKVMVITSFKKHGEGLYYLPALLGINNIDITYFFGKKKYSFFVHSNVSINLSKFKKSFYKFSKLNCRK